MKTTAATPEEQIADLEKEAARLRGVHAWSQEAHIRSHLRTKRAELAAAPKPNALLSLLTTARADLATWVARGVPTAQKLAEIEAMEAAIAARK